MIRARVREAFPDARQGRDDWYLARCPAHPDEHPSLAFQEKDDGWVAFKCRSQGCTRDEILQAAGLALVDIGPERPNPNGQHRADHEAKRWRIGDWLHIRFEDSEGRKTRVPWAFADGALCPSGKGPKTPELPLYGAELLTDLPDGAVVYVGEGEKSADALRWAGLMGVGTVTGAEGAPCDESLSVLLRFRVRLWPDNDTPGLRHMQRIATRLVLLGCQSVAMVRWPEAPEKGDAADLLQSFAKAKDRDGATAAVEALVLEAWTDDHAPVVDAKLARLQAATYQGADILSIPKPDPLIDGLLDLGTIVGLYGASSTGKSYYGIDLTLTVGSGGSWQGADVEPQNVLYIAAEGAFGIGDRVKAWLVHHQNVVKHPDISRVHWQTVPANLFDAEWGRALIQHAIDLGSKLVIIDTLAAAMAGGDDSSSKDMGIVMDVAHTLIRETGCCVFIIHHTGYDESHARGSTAFRAACDTEIQVKKSGELITVTVTKQRHRETGRKCHFRLKLVEGTGQCVLVAADEQTDGVSATAIALLSVLSDIDPKNEGSTLVAWRASSDCGERHFYRLKAELVKAELISAFGKGNSARFILTTDGLAKVAGL